MLTAPLLFVGRGFSRSGRLCRCLNYQSLTNQELPPNKIEPDPNLKKTEKQPSGEFDEVPTPRTATVRPPPFKKGVVVIVIRRGMIVCVFVYICVYIYIYICIYTAFANMYSTNMGLYKSKYVCMCIELHVYTYTYM